VLDRWGLRSKNNVARKREFAGPHTVKGIGV
jgi:hypothetical protein